MRYFGLFLFLLATFGQARCATIDYRGAPRFALVVGNGNYAGALKLRNAHNDARLIADKLRGAGYVTDLVLDADRATLYKALAKLAGNLKNGGVGALYYAGHGLDIKGRNYLIPVDAPVNAGSAALAQAALPVNEVSNRLRDSGAHLSLLLLDACRNDPDGQLQPLYRGGNGPAGFTAQTPAKGMLIAYATQPGERALDGRGANSPFALALADWIVKPGLPIEEAIKHVMSDVRASTRDEQRPWLATSLVGNFALVPAPGVRAMLASTSQGGNADGSAARGPAPQDNPMQQWFEALNNTEQMTLNSQINRQAAALNRDDLPRLKRQAGGGHVIAAAVLGTAYRQGFGVGQQTVRSNQQALKWFKLAARQNLPYALNELGEMYFLGQGVERDNRQAKVYLQAAAGQGYMPAKLNLLQLNAEAGQLDPVQLLESMGIKPAQPKK